MDNILDFIPPSTYFEISFGLIISIVLFFIDRRGKGRQEESLRRQDESLDIILDQVSKVNLFQTKTLSLAIESLGKDLENFQRELNSLKTTLESIDFKTIEKGITNDAGDFESVPPKEIEKTQTEPVSHSSRFAEILGKQISEIGAQIKKSISDLGDFQNKKENDLYKTKKVLESDMKDFLNIESLLSELKENTQLEIIKNLEQGSKEKDKNYDLKKQEKESHSDSSKETERIRSEKLSKKSNKTKEKSRTSRVSKEDLEDFTAQLDSLKSIPELVKFTENIFSLIDSPSEINDSKTDKRGKRVKIKPTKKKSSDE